jgi:accessory gene regulator protein AgrB
MIYSLISERFVDVMVERKVANPELKHVYKYYMEKYFSAIGSSLILLLIGITTNKLIEIIIFIAFYSSLRSASGGAHAGTHTKCLFGYMAIMFALIGTAGFISANYPGGFKWIVMALILTANALVYKYAPVGCRNRQFSKKAVELLRKRSIATVTTETIIIALTLIILKNANYYIAIAALAFTAQSVTLLPCFKANIDKEEV